MRFTQDPTSTVNIIRAYGAGEIRVNDTTFRSAVLVSAAALHAEPEAASVTDLGGEQARRILDLQPEVVLLGTGSRQTFPPAAFGATFLEQGIGFEVMDTGAACRTYNVLVGEQRRVAALLLI